MEDQADMNPFAIATFALLVLITTSIIY